MKLAGCFDIMKKKKKSKSLPYVSRRLTYFSINLAICYDYSYYFFMNHTFLLFIPQYFIFS